MYASAPISLAEGSCWRHWHPGTSSLPLASQACFFERESQVVTVKDLCVQGNGECHETGVKHKWRSMNGEMATGFSHLMVGGDLDKNSFFGVVGTDACLNWDQERRGIEKKGENLFSRLAQ